MLIKVDAYNCRAKKTQIKAETLKCETCLQKKKKRKKKLNAAVRSLGPLGTDGGT